MAAWDELVAPLNAHNLDGVGECKRIIDSALETDYRSALADFLATKSRLLASPGATRTMEEALRLFQAGEAPTLRVGWFPFRQGG